MELTINFEKKYVYGISLILIILIGIFSVRAYAYTNSIPSPGHGGDKVWIDVDPTDTLFLSDVKKGEKTLQDAIDQGNFSGRQGVPVRNYKTTNDCRESLTNVEICVEGTDTTIDYPVQVNFGVKTFCALRELIEWSPADGDTKSSSCTVTFNSADNKWILKSDGAECRSYCLDWS